MAAPWNQSSVEADFRCTEFMAASCSAPKSDVIWFASQPRPTKIAAATFGWRAYPAIVRRSTAMLSPMSMPQPVPCVSAITPSTLG